MDPRRRLALSIAFVLAIGAALSLSPRARGAETTEPVRIELSAHEGCPDSSGFFDEIRARTPRVRRAATGEAARSLRVSIVRVSGQSVGELVLRAVDGSTSTRSVTGASCGEVVEALAFIAAVSIDPSASITKSASTAASSSPAPTSSIAVPVAASNANVATSATAASPSAVAPPAASTVAPIAAEARPSPPPPPPIEAPTTRTPSTRDRTRFSAGFGVALIGAQIPGSLIATPLHFELGLERASVFAPSLRLAVSRRSSGLVTSDVGRARFRWSIAELDGCPLRIRVFGALAVRPCVGVEAGVLAASGEAIARAHDVSRAWVAARAMARVQVLLLDTLTLELQLGAAIPLTRDEFSFDPSAPTATTVYRAPAIVPLLALDVSVFFS